MTTMPAQTYRTHLDPYWLGDSIVAIRKTALRKPGNRFIDLNLQRCANGVIVIHWGTAGKGGWNYIVKRDGKGRRRMTQEELNRPIKDWNVTDVLRWRRTARADGNFESKVRPMTYEEAIAACKRYYVVPCFELKSYSFGDVATAVSMVTYANVYARRRVYFMTLVTMPGWQHKGVAFKKAQQIVQPTKDVGKIALLAHGAHKPADLSSYFPAYYDRVWGSWAA